MKQILTIAALILTITCLGQERSELRHCKTKEFKYDFYVQLDDKNVRYKDTVLYVWFRAQKLHTTQGMSDGYLLNGPFKKYYHSGQIAEQGSYKNGLRIGEWKSWRESGTLIAIYHYSSGSLHGSYSLFGAEGQRVKTGTYKRGNEKVEPLEKEEMKEKKRKFRLFRKDDRTDLPKEEKRKKKEKKKVDTTEKEKRPFLQRIFGKRTKKESSKPKKEEKGTEDSEKKSTDEETVIPAENERR